MGTFLKLGLVVGRNETWSFIRDLHEDWQRHYRVEVFNERDSRSPVFRERLNRWRLNRDLAGFLAGHDVVFFEWASELLVMASRLPKTSQIITRLHRYEMYQWVDQVNWDAVDAVILVSEAKRREFEERFPIQAGKCYVIPPGIDLTRFPFQPKPFSGDIGILCHLSPRKRVYELILTFYELVRQYPGLRLHIGGGPQPGFGDYYLALTDIVRRLGLSECVYFDGPVTDTPAWYRKIDIYISNSYSEGLQVSPMEAMATGCYTLSHWWAGADELLPQDYLFITDKALIEKVESYLGLTAKEKEGKLLEQRRIVEDKFDVGKLGQAIRAIIESNTVFHKNEASYSA